MHFLTLYKIAPAKFKKTNDDKNVVAYLAEKAGFGPALPLTVLLP